MKTNRPASGHRDRRIAGHAQQDHVLDPYQGSKKPAEGTVCPGCGAVYGKGRWQWSSKPDRRSHEELCPACKRIRDKLPAGVVALRGESALRHKQELLQLAQHQEEAEKGEHPLNRIMGVKEDDQGIVIETTDIHLPRRIGEAVKRAFHGELETHFEQDGFFVRVNWKPPNHSNL
jgi:NMD protein affecting ribosome stability and mRNA decay